MRALAAKGYSLIEMTVALAIAAVISAAALSVYSTLVGSMYALRAQSSVDTRLQRIGRSFAADLQEVGGGAIRPWHAALVQPNLGAADGLMVMTADGDSRPCAVKLMDPALLQIEGACPICVPEVPPVAGKNREYVGRFAVVSQAGGIGTVVVIQGVGLGGAVDCNVKSHAFVDMAPGALPGDWAGASLTVVNAKWIFLDPLKNELKAWMLFDAVEAPLVAVVPPALGRPRGVLGAYKIDERLLATDIYDFEVALGYDVDFDNVVVDTVGGANDEWFGNAAGEMPAADWIGDANSEFLSPLVLDPTQKVEQIRLRSMQLGFVMGVKARGPPRDPIQVFDGAAFAADGVYFRRATAVAMFRNAGATQ